MQYNFILFYNTLFGHKKIIIIMAIFLYNIAMADIKSIYSSRQIKQCITNMFIHDHPALIVDWTPKAGCTCVWKMLFDNYGILQNALQYSSWIHDYRIHFYLKQHTPTINKFSDPNYCKIKFVRNPYYRAISSYLYVCKKTNFKKSFKDFLLSIKTQKWQNLTIQEIKFIQVHFRKQYKYTDKFMDYIIPIEHANLDEINKKTGLHLSLNNYTSEHHNHYLETYSEYVGDAPYTEMDCYPPYYCYYSPETLQLVREIYKEDIASYHYETPQEIIDFVTN